MHGLGSNPALFWAHEKAELRQPILILSRAWRWGVRRMLGLGSDSALFFHPQDGRGGAANSNFVPALGVGESRECRC